MLGTKNFVMTLLTTFITILLFINIIFTFNFHTTIGLPTPTDADLSGSYFGISNIIDAFTNYWGNNQVIKSFQDFNANFLKMIRTISFTGILSNATGVANGLYGTPVFDILNGLFFIFDLLVNIPYTLGLVVYFLLFAIYLIFVIFQFLFFIFYLLGGYVRSELPKTYDDITLIPPLYENATFIYNSPIAYIGV